MIFLDCKSELENKDWDPFVHLTVRSRLAFYRGIQTNVDYYRVFVLYIDSSKNTLSFCQLFVSKTRGEKRKLIRGQIFRGPGQSVLSQQIHFLLWNQSIFCLGKIIVNFRLIYYINIFRSALSAFRSGPSQPVSSQAIARYFCQKFKIIVLNEVKVLDNRPAFYNKHFHNLVSLVDFMAEKS